MRKLVGVIIAGVIAVICYQWLEKNSDVDWQQQVTSTIQEKVDDTALLIKDGLKMDSPSETEKISKEKFALSDHEVIVKYLASHLADRQKELKISIQGNSDDIKEQFPDLLQKAIDADDYVKYTIESYHYSMSSLPTRSEITITVVYRESYEMSEEVRNYAKQVIGLLELDQYSQFEQVKLIHDWIVTHVQYDQSLTRYTAYEAITDGTTVCQGYALLGYRFYSEAGFEVRIVEGSVNTGEHAWNLVKIDGDWYQLDLTWDDPLGQAEDAVSYKYYLISDEQLAQDHIWEKNYPVATTSYKDLLNKQLEAADPSSEVYQHIKQAREQLGYHMEDSSNTIASYEQLKAAVKAAVASHESELKFRYLGGDQLVDDVNKAFKSLNKSLSYRISYQEWSDAGDLLVTIMVDYK